MKTQPTLLFLTIFMITSLACSLGLPQVSRIQTGATQTLTLNEPRSNTEAVQDVNLTMAFGEFNLSGGAESLLEGEVRYNVAEWQPSVTKEDSSLTITQGEVDDTGSGLPDENIINEWTVRLGDVPMNLSLRAGAYDGTLDLSGLRLQRLDVQDGASRSEIRFDTLNREEMRSLTYRSGASRITFLGLANANFTQMTFEGGAGEYVFDFSGDLQRDANVDIKVGLSNVQILVPAGISAKVFVDDRLDSVSTDGAWIKESDHYVNDGGGNQLTINVDMGVGSLRLGNQEQ
ncbi:MAG TPA: toast rack family protein [Anaerolineales bacterium]